MRHDGNAQGEAPRRLKGAWIWIALVITAVVGAAAGCGGGSGPEVSGQAATVTALTETNGGTGLGLCMQDDAKYYGMINPRDSLNCTANDIVIASATAYGECDNADPTTCRSLSAGGQVTCHDGYAYVQVQAMLKSNATSERQDIGVWIDLNSGRTDALTGTCQQFILPVGSVGTVNGDADGCAGMTQGATTYVDLGLLKLPCDTDSSNHLLVGSCLGWRQPGADRDNVCNSGDSRSASLPANKSKCNCAPFTLDVYVDPCAKVTCTTDKCHTAACDSATGKCVETAIPASACDDGNACTADACDGATGCTHTAVSVDDGNACTVDACDPTTGAITHRAVSVDDGNACTVDACDPATGAITHTAVSVDDGNACTVDACDPATGAITHTAVSVDDGNACTVDACDPKTGAITHMAVSVDDGNACTVDACNTLTGAITHTAVSVDDGNACTVDACDPATGAITHTAVSVDDSNACTVDACDPATGAITHTAVSVDDGNACTVDACDPATGAITHTAVSVDDSNACTVDACDPATGAITHTAVSVDDGNACTTDACDPATGAISHVDNGTCGEWCSPGFWATSPSCSPIDLGICYGTARTGFCAGTALTTGSGTGEGCVTLRDVLASPDTYGGEAFNCVGDLLSTASPDVNFSGNRTGVCPLAAASSSTPCARVIP